MMCLALMSNSASVAIPEPNYVTFSIMGPMAFGPKIINGIVQPRSLWAETEKTAVEEMRKEFGEQRPGQQRYIGFSVWIPTLNLTLEQLKAEIVSALDLAERNKIPVFFHLDDEHMLWGNPEFLQNKEMAEWSDFPKAGSKQGPVVPRYWLNWGDPANVYPVPPLCFACQQTKAIMAKRLKECVALPIVQRLNRWRKEGKEYLFAGLASGNETKVPDFSRGYEGYRGVGEPGGLDNTQFPAIKNTMTKTEMLPIGYHSLSVMGFNKQTIENLARAQHKTKSRIVHELLFKVAQDYAEFQTRTLNLAGLPKSNTYTHFTSTNYTMGSLDDQLKAIESQPSASARPGSDNMAPPVVASVNQHSRPGFTIVKNGVDLNELVSQLQKAGAPDRGMSWAAVESYACSGQPGTPQTQVQYEQYLGGLLSHGAKVVNCYGWNITSGPYTVKTSGVIPAVKAWVNGKKLPSDWSCSDDIARQKSIQEKVAILQRAAHDFVNSGNDPHKVQHELETFQREFEPLLKSGKFVEAESSVDKAIVRIKALK